MMPLDPAQLAAIPARLPGWAVDDGVLVRTWRFATFSDAMAFMQDAAHEIDRLGHHPAWTNRYDRVEARLSTWDAGGKATAKDVELAKTLDWVAQRFTA